MFQSTPPLISEGFTVPAPGGVNLLLGLESNVGQPH